MSCKKYWEARDTGSSDSLTPSLSWSWPPPRPSTWQQPLGASEAHASTVRQEPGAQGAGSSGVCGMRHEEEGVGGGRGGRPQLRAIRPHGLQVQTAVQRAWGVDGRRVQLSGRGVP